MGQRSSVPVRYNGVTDFVAENKDLKVEASIDVDGKIVKTIYLNNMINKPKPRKKGEPAKKVSPNETICAFLDILRAIMSKKYVTIATEVVLGYPLNSKMTLDWWENYFRNAYRTKSALVDLGFRKQGEQVITNLYGLYSKLNYLCYGKQIDLKSAGGVQSVKDVKKELKEKEEKAKARWSKIKEIKAPNATKIKPVYSFRAPYNCIKNCEGLPPDQLTNPNPQVVPAGMGIPVYDKEYPYACKKYCEGAPEINPKKKDEYDRINFEENLKQERNKELETLKKNKELERLKKKQVDKLAQDKELANQKLQKRLQEQEASLPPPLPPRPAIPAPPPLPPRPFTKKVSAPPPIAPPPPKKQKSSNSDPLWPEYTDPPVSLEDINLNLEDLTETSDNKGNELVFGKRRMTQLESDLLYLKKIK